MVAATKTNWNELKATWPARMEAGERIPTDEMSYFKNTVQTYRQIINTLNESGAKREIRDSSGLASDKLRRKAKLDVSLGAFNQHIVMLIDCGWVERDKKDKRVYRIALTDGEVPPSELLVSANGESQATEARSSDVQEEAPPAPNGTASAALSSDAAEKATTTVDEPPLDDEDYADLTPADLDGARPGRFAKRIESSIPILVRSTMNEMFEEWLNGLMGALGYGKGATLGDQQRFEAELDTLSAENARLRSQIEKQIDDMKVLAGMVDFLKDDEDERLKRTEQYAYSKRNTMSVSQLPPVLRRLGGHAIQHGWAIRAGRGGHLIWENAAGKKTFSGSTPSDSNVEQIMWRKLRRLGLVDYPKS